MYVAIAASRKPRAARIDLTDGARARSVSLNRSKRRRSKFCRLRLKMLSRRKCSATWQCC